MLTGDEGVGGVSGLGATFGAVLTGDEGDGGVFGLGATFGIGRTSDEGDGGVTGGEVGATFSDGADVGNTASRIEVVAHDFLEANDRPVAD